MIVNFRIREISRECAQTDPDTDVNTDIAILGFQCFTWLTLVDKGHIGNSSSLSIFEIV